MRRSRGVAASRATGSPGEDAVRRDIDAIGEREPEVAGSGLAALALSLAREMDDPGNSATSKSMCARALADALDRLRELAPERKESPLEAIKARRERRLREADAKNRVGAGRGGSS